MTSTSTQPTREAIATYFTYCPETGRFTRIGSIGSKRRDMVGKTSGSVNKINGYVEMSLLGRKQYGHRLAWIYMRGPIPEGFTIDHINGNRSDNRIENLRLASKQENSRNVKQRKMTVSGIKGVSFDRSRGKWLAYVGTEKLGRFDNLFEAACVRKSAANRRFREFARE